MPFSGQLLSISAVMRYLEEVTKLGEVGLKTAMQQTLGGSVAEEILFAGERLIERGRSEGEIAGRREGEIAGQRAILLRQLGKRFGALPTEAVARVQAATPSELDGMSFRVLTASRLEDALGKKKRRRG